MNSYKVRVDGERGIKLHHLSGTTRVRQIRCYSLVAHSDVHAIEDAMALFVNGGGVVRSVTVIGPSGVTHMNLVDDVL